MAVDPLLTAKGLTVQFGGLRALSDVHVEVPEGAIVGIVGPNGAGKTTLFGVLSGLIPPNSGRVWLRGEEISQFSPAARAHAGMGRTFQQSQLFTGLTVREHLQLAYRMRYARRRIWSDLVKLALAGKPDQAELDRCSYLLSMLQLESHADGPVLGLPLGVMRLVEVARALALSPSILLLDEPLAGLDSLESKWLVDVLVATSRAEGIGVLLVEHDFESVFRISDSMVVMDFGVVIAAGTPAIVRDLPEVRAAYLGEGFVGGSPLQGSADA